MDEKLNHLDNGVLGVAVLTDRCSDTGSYSRSASAELISSHYKLTLFIVCCWCRLCETDHPRSLWFSFQMMKLWLHQCFIPLGMDRHTARRFSFF